MNLDSALSQLRPILSLAGSIIIAAGLLDYAGVGNIPGDGIYTAVCGWLLKGI